MNIDNSETHKVILSRKGFDSTAGGIASPVINNQFFSLPIPESGSELFYKDLKLLGTDIDMLSLIRQLGARQFSECHMDPNLNPAQYGLNINDGWNPAFGQDEVALTHLRSTHNIKEGDIFLFFGLFRNAKISQNSIQYTDKKKFHSIYGFMEIGEIINIEKELSPDQKIIYRNHPHIKKQKHYKQNSTLFIPATKSIHGFQKTVSTFKIHNDLILTDIEQAHLSHWKMKEPFWNKEFSYNLKIDSNGIVKSPGRGQEFVGTATPEILEWIKQIIYKDIN